MPVTKDDEIFEGKSFSDLLKDIYNNSKTKSRQINSLIGELKPFLKKIEDAALIVPLIKDYMDIAVKNDDQLVKTAQVYQRYIAAANRIYDSEEGNDGVLTEEEKRQLLENQKERAKEEMKEIIDSDKFDEEFGELMKNTDDVLRFDKKKKEITNNG